MRNIFIEQNDAGQRVDRFLKKYLRNAPLSSIYKIVRKDLKVNGKRVKEDYLLNIGDELCIYQDDIQLDAWTLKKESKKSKKQFTVVYEDDSMLIVNKPYGLLVHGDKNEKKDTLANQVIDYLIDNGSYNPRLCKTFTPSPVHRLDRNTTGIVVFGKTAESLRKLSAALREDGNISKFYYTIVHGKLDKELHLKNKLLKDEARNIGRVLPVDDEKGKYIETIVRPKYSSKDGKYTLVEIELITGRSHQIRAHLSFAGYPLVGDTKYGGKEIKSKTGEWSLGKTTQALHAYKIIIDGREYVAKPPIAWESIQNDLLGKVIV